MSSHSITSSYLIYKIMNYLKPNKLWNVQDYFSFDEKTIANNYIKEALWFVNHLNHQLQCQLWSKGIKTWNSRLLLPHHHVMTITHPYNCHNKTTLLFGYHSNIPSFHSFHATKTYLTTMWPYMLPSPIAYLIVSTATTTNLFHSFHQPLLCLNE